MGISETMIKFIQEHAKDDTNALRLKYGGKSGQMDFPIDFALLQIEARRKAQKKIPSMLENDLFFFPDLLAAEQASNEIVAKFHASLLPPGSSLLDLTAGLGIDDLTFAKAGINVVACEIDKTRSEVLIHNSEVLNLADKITVMNVDSMEYVKTCTRHFDTIFSDPARRSTTGKRLHALSDCQPDLLAEMKTIMSISDWVLIKSSPLLDLTLIRNTVTDLYQIYVVCFKGECKEVLIDIRKDSTFEGVTVVDLDRDGEMSRFFTEFKASNLTNKAALSDRKKVSDYRYLYEPNAGIMKTGAWNDLAARYPELSKADPNTHIFLSDTLYSDFPGRIGVITQEADKKALKALKGTKINVVARNHPLTSPQICSKFSLTAGGDRFLYALRYKNTPTFILTNPIK